MTKDKKYIVGITRNGYPEQKNFLYAKNYGIEYKRVFDLNKVIDFIGFKLKRTNNPRYHNIRSSVRYPRFDIYHYFNDIAFGKQPWVSTFEYDIPRQLHNSKRAWEALGGDACISLIAMSENARNVQNFLTPNFASEHSSAIMNKLVVLHPPQRLYEAENIESHIPTVTFVGNAFYHKGGYEMLRAMDAIWESGVKCDINIVSNFSKTNWLDKHISKSDENKVFKLIDKWSSNITLYHSIDNESVINLFKQSNVAILPSFGETYGYAVLEAQACGCPVITTNSWAFPEINNNSIGWLLDLPTITENGGLKAKMRDQKESMNYRKLLVDSIEATIREAINNIDLTREKGLNARDKIRIMHSPDNHAESLKAIYKTSR